MRRLGNSWFFVLAFYGCAAAPPRSAPARATPPVAAAVTAPAAIPALPEKPLNALVPAAGLQWLLLLRPSELAAHAELRAASQLLVPEGGWERYARVTGIQPLALSALLIARFDLATVYLFDAPAASVSSAVRSFRERSAVSVRARRPHPAIELLSGVIDGSPESFITLGSTRVGVVVGSPLLAEAVVAFAWRSLRSKHALQDEVLARLAARLGDAPLQFYVPGPLPSVSEAAPADPAQALPLLARATALAAGIRLAPTNLQGSLLLQGAFDAADLSEATSLWSRLIAGTTGKLLNLPDALGAARFHFEAEQLELQASIEARALAAGLHTAVGAEVDELTTLPEGLEALSRARGSEPSRSLDN